jgi:hypothetical protein
MFPFSNKWIIFVCYNYILMGFRLTFTDDVDSNDFLTSEGCIVITGAERMQEFGSEVPSVLVNMAECEALINAKGSKALLAAELDGQEYLKIPWTEETIRIAAPANITAGGHELTLLLRSDTAEEEEIDSAAFQFFRWNV